LALGIGANTAIFSLIDADAASASVRAGARRVLGRYGGLAVTGSRVYHEHFRDSNVF
jgi:hypothetical protein